MIACTNAVSLYVDASMQQIFDTFTRLDLCPFRATCRTRLEFERHLLKFRQQTSPAFPA